MIMKSGGLGRGDGDLEGGVLGGVFDDIMATSIWAKVNECVPIFSAGMRPLATIFSRVGMDTRSRRTLCLARHSGAAHRCHFPRYQR